MIEPRKHQRSGVPILLGTCLIFAFACKKAPAPPAVRPASVGTVPSAQTASERPSQQPRLSESEVIARIKSNPTLTETQKESLSALVPGLVAGDRQEIKDRKELVLSPPAGWKPENVRRKIKLTLIPEKTMIRAGERFRYRLETQNVGQEPVMLSEDQRAFVKTGNLSGPWYRFYVTLPDGKKEQLDNTFHPSFIDVSPLHEYHFPATMTSAQKDAAFKQIQLQEHAESAIRLELLPGETVVTRPDPPPPNRFRDMDADLVFKKPGTYRVKATFEEPPLKPESEKHIQAMIKEGISREDQLKMHEKMNRDSLGIIESNTVLLEVVP